MFITTKQLNNIASTLVRSKLPVTKGIQLDKLTKKEC
jgi:hypothetical protein